MKKQHLVMALVLVSIVIAFAIRLYAVLPDCVNLWNLCQEYCSGTPYMVVYASGIIGVGCKDGQWPCSPNWGPWDCL